jgi:hypothetical protein
MQTPCLCMYVRPAYSMGWHLYVHVHVHMSVAHLLASMPMPRPTYDKILLLG